jgi:hypothetical protein
VAGQCVGLWGNTVGFAPLKYAIQIRDCSFVLAESNLFFDENEKSSKKVLTSEADSCNIIQVADRHGNETAQQALIGRPLERSEKLQKRI